MNITVCKDYEEMSVKAAELIANDMKKKDNFVLGLATGSTPGRNIPKLNQKE